MIHVFIWPFPSFPGKTERGSYSSYGRDSNLQGCHQVSDNPAETAASRAFPAGMQLPGLTSALLGGAARCVRHGIPTIPTPGTAPVGRVTPQCGLAAPWIRVFPGCAVMSTGWQRGVEMAVEI